MKLLTTIRIYREVNDGKTKYLARATQGLLTKVLSAPDLRTLGRMVKREILT
jgi:hypothetical protein